MHSPNGSGGVQKIKVYLLGHSRIRNYAAPDIEVFFGIVSH